jgi:hypothetical protein
MLSYGSTEILRFPQNDGCGNSESKPQSVTQRHQIAYIY